MVITGPVSAVDNTSACRSRGRKVEPAPALVKIEHEIISISADSRIAGVSYKQKYVNSRGNKCG